MLNMNVDAIGEVKILTQGYQADTAIERSADHAVTKERTNKFAPPRHPDELDWDANSWVNERTAIPR